MKRLYIREMRQRLDQTWARGFVPIGYICPECSHVEGKYYEWDPKL